MKFLLKIWLHFNKIGWQFIQNLGIIRTVLTNKSFISSYVLINFWERIVEFLNAVKVLLINDLFFTAQIASHKISNPKNNWNKIYITKLLIQHKHCYCWLNILIFMIISVLNRYLLPILLLVQLAYSIFIYLSQRTHH